MRVKGLGPETQLPWGPQHWTREFLTAVPWQFSGGVAAPARDRTIIPLFTGLAMEQLVGKMLFFFWSHFTQQTTPTHSPSCHRACGAALTNTR